MKQRFYDWYKMHFYKIDEPEEPDWLFIMAFAVMLLFTLVGFYILS